MSWPHHVGDSASVLVSSLDGTIGLVRLESGAWQDVAGLQGTDPVYLDSGDIVYTRRGDLYAARFDPADAVLLGSPVPVQSGVHTGRYGVGQYAVSATGTLVVVPEGPTDRGQLVWRARSSAGGVEPTAIEGVRRYGEFRLSPDGTRVAATVFQPNHQLWIGELKSGRWWQLAEKGGRAIWSPDGTRVYYHRDDVEIGIYRVAVREGAASERVVPRRARTVPFAVTKDEKTLLIGVRGADGDFDLFLLDLADLTIEPFVRDSWGPVLSPDGAWVAYTHDDAEVQILPFPPSEGDVPVTVSRHGGEEPVWSARGDEIFFRDRFRWYSIPVKTQPALEIGEPKLVFEGDFAQVPGFSYDYDASAERFLVLQGVDRAANEIRVSTAWTETLRRLAGASNDTPRATVGGR